MTDLEFFKEFLTRFDLGIPSIEDTDSYYTVYAINLFNQDAENAGNLYFTFENKTGKIVADPYFQGWEEERDIQDTIDNLDIDQALDAMEYLVGKLKRDY